MWKNRNPAGKLKKSLEQFLTVFEGFDGPAAIELPRRDRAPNQIDADVTENGEGRSVRLRKKRKLTRTPAEILCGPAVGQARWTII
jgi:hypothetical protein